MCDVRIHVCNTGYYPAICSSVVLVRSVPGTGSRAVPGQVLVVLLYISLNCGFFY